MGDELRFVFDTNVSVGAIILPRSVPRLAIARAIGLGRIIHSAETLDELAEVLDCPRFDRFSARNRRRKTFTALTRRVVTIPVATVVQECRDPDDDKFLALAIDGAAACVVTGDRDLLVLHPFRNIPILTPRAFLDATWREPGRPYSRDKNPMGRACGMIFQVTFERDEDGMWCVSCPAIPGCHSQGKTRDEAVENIKDAIKLCLEARAELGMPLTVDTQQVEVAV